MNSKIDQLEKNKEGYIYFFTNGENIKIGFTKNKVQNRLKQLNTGNDYQLYCLGFFKGKKEDEKFLHKKFSKFRIRNNGEWFYPDDVLIDYLNKVNENQNVYISKNELYNNRVMALLKV